MSLPVRVLFIEDNPGDARLVREELRLAAPRTAIQLEWVDRLQAGLEYIAAHQVDAVLLDLSLPDSSGLETLQQVLAHAPRLPVIVMTGQADEETGIRAVQAGAQDYLIKGEVDGRLLARSIQYSIERKQSAAHVAAMQKRFQALIENAPDGIALLELDGKLRQVTPSTEQILGYTIQEAQGQDPAFLTHPADLPALLEVLGDLIQNPGKVARAQYRFRHKDGSWRWLESTISNLVDEPGVEAIVFNYRDITDRKRAEADLQEKERLLSDAQRIGRIGSWSYDLTGDRLQFSDEMYRLFGILPAEFSHTMQGVLDLIYSIDRPAVIEWVDEIRAGIPVRELSFRVLGGNQGLRYMECRGATRLDPESNTTLFVGTMQDVTERKLADLQIRQQIQRLNALREIDRAISSSSDLGPTLEVVLSQVIKQLQVDAAIILLLDADQQSFVSAAGQGLHQPLTETTRIPLLGSHAGQVARESRLIRVANLKEKPDHILLNPWMAAEQFVCFYGVPLIAKGKVIGVLEVFHREPLIPHSEWLDFLNTLAGQTAIAIENAKLFENLQKSNDELSKAYDATIVGWSRALDLRDRETEGHTLRVTAMTMKLAQSFGFSEEELLHIRWGALLHDIGKMGVPDTILLKQDPLTEAEWLIMRKHAEYAYDLLREIEFLKFAVDIPYCHHEKWDGSGYPRGLKGTEIPMTARLFAVVDVWDALVSGRPYRAAWSEEQALTYLREQSGRHFDPQVVELFFKIRKE